MSEVTPGSTVRSPSPDQTPEMSPLTNSSQDKSPVAASVAAPAVTPSLTPQTRVAQPLTPPPPASSEPIFCVEDDPTLTPSQHMLAGAFAGMTEHLAMFPVDTIKTRMQSYTASRDYHSMIHTTRTLIASDGLRALWRGVGAVALSAGPAHALYFATYESVRNSLTPNDGGVHPIPTAIAGGCATVVADGIMTPLDVVKQRMQLAHGYRSVWHCTHAVYSNYGLRAFFAGYKATLLMNVPFTAVYFCGYEAAKKLILDYRNIDPTQFSAPSHCAAGAVAGAAAAAATNPLDVVKTRLQTQGEVGARRYRGLADALRSIRVEEGVSGLMRGVRPRVLFHMPAAAVCWTTYEFCKHIMRAESH